MPTPPAICPRTGAPLHDGRPMMADNSSRANWFAPCAVVGALLATAPMARAGDAAREWLQRMNQALATRNYDGTFFHLSDGRVETMRIVHRVQGGRVTERLMSLDGSGREFVRNGDALTCYLPDQHTVLVEPRAGARSVPRVAAAIRRRRVRVLPHRGPGRGPCPGPRGPKDHRHAQGPVSIRLSAVARREHGHAAQDTVMRFARPGDRTDPLCPSRHARQHPGQRSGARRYTPRECAG